MTTMARTWIVQVNNSILGPVVPQARPKGGTYRPARQLPQGLRDYLNLPAERNVRPRMQDFTRIEEIDQLGIDQYLVKRTTKGKGYTRLLTIVLPDSSLPDRRARPTVPAGVKAIRNLRQLCAHFGADDPAGLNHRIYKDTSCGASISLLLADGTWRHNGDERLRQLPVSAKIVGFTIQTIVEGSEATVDSDPFYLPVRVSEVEAWMVDMEAQASILWDEANTEGEDEGDEA